MLLIPSTQVFRSLSSRIRFVGVAVLMASLLIACSSNDEPDRGSTADAYAVVIRWFVERAESDVDRPLVFVETLGDGVGFGLDTQAAVVSSTAEFAEVRFIDDRAEAFENDEVRGGGILIALGPAVESGRSATIESAQFTSESDSVGWTFDLVSRGATWSLTGEPVRGT